MSATTCERCGEEIADGARVWVESETPGAADICRARLCPPCADKLRAFLHGVPA